MTKRKHQPYSEDVVTKQVYSKRRASAEAVTDMEAFVEEISSVYNGNSDEPQNYSSLLADKVLIDLKLARYENAVDSANKCLSTDECNFKARYCKALALIKLKRIVESLPDLKKCVEISQKNPEVCQLLEQLSEESQKNSINRLTADGLIEIFLLLPFRERMLIELVSMRWNRVVKAHGWSNFRRLPMPSYRERVSRLKMKIKGYQKKVVPLFKRCGRFLWEINMTIFAVDKALFRHLSTIPNLQSLHTEFEIRSAGTIESLDGALSAQLKSMNLYIVDNADAWSRMISNCNQLQQLKIYLSVSAPLLSVSPSIKYLHAGGPSFSYQNLRCVSEERSQLASLTLQSGISEVGFNGGFQFDSLKYLSFSIEQTLPFRNTQNIGSFLKNASNTKALDLSIYCLDLNASETSNVIARNSKHLEHLGIVFYNYKQAFFDGFAESYCSLTSLSVDSAWQMYGMRIVDQTFSDFFQNMVLHGNLVYSMTQFAIPTPIICEALKLCTNLKYLSWCYDANTDWTLLLKTLDEIHGSKKPSDDGDFEHVLHIFGFTVLNMPAIEHPWLKLHCGRLESPIREKYRIGCLDNGKPKFVVY